MQLEGYPGAKLCEFGESVDADLIVLGSRGLGELKRSLCWKMSIADFSRMILGSVSSYVVQNSRKSVLVVR